tara:strand:- start:275 stop:1081 length:807 start_codon:yes stop_codon:yes gene_type:complete
MTSYFERIFKNLLVVKIPFAVFALFGMFELIFPFSSSWPLAFWGFYYLILMYLWSWLLASWLTSNLLINEQSNPNLLPRMVQQTFFYQIKLFFVSYSISLLLMLLTIVTLVLVSLVFMKVFASPEVLKSISISISKLTHGAALVEPEISFLKIYFGFSIAIVLILMNMIVLRFSYGMVPLLKGDTKIGLIGSWRKSKGTNLTAFKILLPYTVLSVLGVLYVGLTWPMSNQAATPFSTFLLTTVVMVSTAIFLDCLTKYLPLLNSNHID